MKKWSLILLLSFAMCHAFETNRLTDILPFIHTDTLVIFDVDNTLIRPAHQLGSTGWSYHVARRLVANGIDQQEAYDEACSRLSCVLRFSEMTLVDPTAPSFIKVLQSEGIAVMGLTARAPDTSYATCRQLLSFDIDLTPTSPQVDEAIDLPLKGLPRYAHGVIFAGYRVDKGKALCALLDRLDYRPARVIMIDDRANQVQRVEEALNALNIDCVAVRYTGTDMTLIEFDPDVADVQWEQFGKILSDQEAMSILGRTP